MISGLAPRLTTGHVGADSGVGCGHGDAALPAARSEGGGAQRRLGAGPCLSSVRRGDAEVHLRYMALLKVAGASEEGDLAQGVDSRGPCLISSARAPTALGVT